MNQLQFFSKVVILMWIYQLRKENVSTMEESGLSWSYIRKTIPIVLYVWDRLKWSLKYISKQFQFFKLKNDIFNRRQIFN